MLNIRQGSAGPQATFTHQITTQTQTYNRPTLAGAFGLNDCFHQAPLAMMPGRTPQQHLFLQSRYNRYQGMSQAFLYHTPMNEQRSTDYALLGHNDTNRDRQLLANGVAGGTINRGEFHTLARFQRETEFLRAKLREGGYSPGEVDLLNNRMSHYRRLHQAFNQHDFQIPVYQNGNPIDQKLDQAFHQTRNGTMTSQDMLGKLNWTAYNAYGAGMEGRQGPVYNDERRRLRVRFQENRNQAGITDRPREQRNQQPLDRNRAGQLLDGLSQRFGQIDTDRNGRLSRGEMTAIIANPERYGYTQQEAAALFIAQQDISNIRNDGQRGSEDISRGDLTNGGLFGNSAQPRNRAIDRIASGLHRSDTSEGRGLYGPDGVPDPFSIRQNREGSCWLLAGMSTLRPEQIQRMIGRTEDGRVVVQFPGRPPELVAPLTEAERQVYSRADGDWSAYLEKAAAQSFAREGRDINGGFGVDAMQLLTGRGGRAIDLSRGPQNGGPDYRNPAQLHQLLSSAMANGQMVSAGANSNDFDRGVSNLGSSQHAYAVVGYDPRSGTVTLRNPWGENERGDRDGRNDGLFTMSIQEFQTTFSRLDVQHPAPATFPFGG